MENIVQNKWFKLSKYMIGGLLILASILALLAAWYAGEASADAPGTATTAFQVVRTEPDYRIINMLFGFMSLALAVALFANTKPTPVLVLTAVSLVMMIVLFATAGLSIGATSWEDATWAELNGFSATDLTTSGVQ